MSQRSEKLHRQVSQLRADVAELKEHQLTTERFNNALQAVTEEGSTQQLLIERRKAREARETAQEWRRNAVLALILAALIAAVALVISAKAVATEGPTTPPTKVSTISDGRLPGGDTPAQEPLRLDQAHVLEDVTMDGDTISLTLTEDETLALRASENMPLRVQLRVGVGYTLME